VYELDYVTNDAHDQETNTNSLRDLDKFAAIGLCTPVEELDSITDCKCDQTYSIWNCNILGHTKLLRYIGEFFDVIHVIEAPTEIRR
jgi:hypothetical protein